MEDNKAILNQANLDKYLDGMRKFGNNITDRTITSSSCLVSLAKAVASSRDKQ